MKAGIFFTGTGPILILTSYDSFTHPELVGKLATKGIRKFIVYGIALELVRERYGKLYDIILGDLNQSDDLRVLDYDGHHVFRRFSLDELEPAVYYESAAETATA